MALELFDIYRQSSSRSDFITNSGNHKDAGKMYDNWKKMEGKSSTSSSSSYGSGLGSGGTTSTQTQTGGSSSYIDKLVGGLSTGFKMAVGLVDGVAKVTAGAVKLGLDTQIGKGQGDDTLLEIAETIKTQGLLGGAAELALKGGLAVTNQLKEQSILLSDINTKTGISGELSDGLQLSMIGAQAEAKRYGFELADIGSFYTSLVEQSGKFALINSRTIEQALPVAGALNMTLTQLADSLGEYEKVGIGAKEATEAIGKSATRSASLGLNASKVATEMKNSIGKLNEYGFKNGVAGLERMVQKSIEFKLSMDKVSKVAEDVMNPEGAIDMAAKLQMLGGAVGSLGDPIKMMYESTNNMEGLQDSIIDAAKGLATYNKEQGRFEITGINLRRGREMASALGMTMEELGKTAVAAQERVAASTALMSRGLTMTDKDREFITNLSRMQDGEMKIVVPESLQEKLGKQSEITLSKLTEEQKNVLLANKKAFEDMSPKDMAMKQLTETERMVKGIEVMATWAKVQAANLVKGGGAALLNDDIKKLLDSISKAEVISNPKKAQQAGKDAVNAVKDINPISLESFMQGGAKFGDAVKSAFTNLNPIASTQQQPQKVEYTHTIVSNPAGDIFAEAARKNAAVGFSMREVNPREFA
jgi:hypothetical protein